MINIIINLFALGLTFNILWVNYENQLSKNFK